MRKAIVIDGTHLREKYDGRLLTASAQDGDYAIFPLAFAVVDGENDRSWRWFFEQLKRIVPQEDELFFVSDRHASIYAAICKVSTKFKFSRSLTVAMSFFTLDISHLIAICIYSGLSGI